MHEDLLFSVEKLISIKRPITALSSIFDRFSELPTQLLIDLLVATLKDMANPSGSYNTMVSYNIDKAFVNLRTRKDASLETIASLELAFIPILIEHKDGLVIHRFMQENAEFYMDTRAVNEGGKQERDLAETYRIWAAGMPTFNRTSNLLKSIAEQWDMDATYEDTSAEKQKLRD